MKGDLKFLLVEDVAYDAELIHRELRRHGFRYHHLLVDTQQGFLDALEQFAPTLILADYSLPQFSALEALQILKNRELEVPLVLVTGSHSEEAAVECMKAGAEDYVLKSNLSRLPAAVTEVLARERKRPPGPASVLDPALPQMLLDLTADVTCLLTMGGQILYANRAFESVLGEPASAASQSGFISLLHPDDAEPFKKLLEEACFFREPRRADVRLRVARGGWLIFDACASFLVDPNNRTQRLLVVCRDITERKRTELENEHLAIFPRSNPNPVLAFSGDGSLLYCNHASMTLARSLGKDHPRAVLPLNAPNIVKMCMVTGRNNLRMDTTFGSRTISWSFYPIVEQRVVHCYAEEVTQRLNLEAQLRQSQRMESVGQLAAGVAHDFNNILTIIQGHSGLLMGDRGLPASLAESVKQIGVAAERAAGLTRQLLMFSRKQLAQLQLMQLNDVLRSVSNMLRVLVGEQINLRVVSSERLPHINADPGMMEQVIMNLAVNARDAMPQGGRLTISTNVVNVDAAHVEAHPEARLGQFVLLTVSDTGIGMDRETLSRIFEPFFTTKDIGKGTGLGLATVYGILTQHNSWVEVDSSVGEGTAFKVYLPAAAVHHTTASGTTADDDARGGKETILIVEDEPALRELVLEILQRYGYRVFEASNSTEALSIWRERKDEIDLLLTDIMMPESLSGRELAELIVVDKPTLKILYTSGYPVEVLGANATLHDGPNFLQKPYHPQTLARMVRDCLDTREAAPLDASPSPSSLKL